MYVHPRSRTRPTPDPQERVDRASPLVHDPQPEVPWRRAARIEAPTVVDQMQIHPLWLPPEMDFRVLCRGMLGGIVERFLRETIQRDLNLWRQRLLLFRRPHVDEQVGAAGCGFG
jgi:hypothetical protein